MAWESESSQNEVVAERRGPVVTLRLNRPDARNALTPTMLRTIGTMVLKSEADPDVRAVVITGTGDRVFCAGADLRSLPAGERVQAPRTEGDDGFRRLLEGEVSIPVIGAANGTAVGGGLELLFGCDLIIASSQARFGLPEVKRGLFAAGGVMHIANRLPLAIALELALSGETIDAKRAYELGLVNAVVAPEDVLAEALARAEKLAGNGPLGIAATKELVWLAASAAPNAEERLHQWRGIVFSSDDAREGARAFLEKRQPQWQGR